MFRVYVIPCLVAIASSLVAAKAAADFSGPGANFFRAPEFTDAEWWKKNSRLTSNRTLRTVIVRGKATMPAFGKKLTRSEIDLLVERTRSFRQSER